METWTYDKTFEGFLSLVFDCYDRKLFPDLISGNVFGEITIFQSDYDVVSDKVKAERVWKGLHKKISKDSCRMLFRAFLSELQDVELLLLNYIKEVFAYKGNIELDFGNDNILEILKINKKVVREAERVMMFVRFQKTADDIYYSSFEPKYNVLPLTMSHFEKRFADQKWVVYDVKRNYGFYYDMKSTQEVRFTQSSVNPLDGKIDDELLAKDEKKFQGLWKAYYDSICIRERVNPSLHMQLMPKRFWKYLPEKDGDL